MNGPTLIVDLQRSQTDAHERFEFSRSPVRIGRGQDNELRIEHAFVSHCHAVLHFDDSGIDIVDLGSTNGSYLAGKRLVSHRTTPLYAGSTLGIGPLRLRLSLDLYAGHERPEPAPIQQSDQRELAALLIRFAHCFVDLHRGQRIWLRELGLATPSEEGLLAIDDPSALVTYLLTPDHEKSRIGELELACKLLLRHELALVHAIGAGARDLLEELSPSALAPRGVSGVIEWFSRLAGHDARWSAFERQYEELQEENVRARIMVGRSFRAAYAHTTGQRETEVRS